jgi:hypothetical protein
MIILFCTAYHAAFMLAAPVICIRLSFEVNSGWKGRGLSFFHALFPENISAAGVLLVVAVFIICIAYVIAMLALVFRIPMAITKWNIAHLTGLLYGKWTRTLPYILMMTGPALYFTIAVILKKNEIINNLFNGMIITVISQYGALFIISAGRSVQELYITCRQKGAGGMIFISFLKEDRMIVVAALTVLLFSTPLIILAVLSYFTGIKMAGSLSQWIVFHVFLFQSLAGSIVFYKRHYGEFLELLFEVDNDYNQ